MDKMNTLCNNSRHLTYLVESFCNNSRISEVIGSIFRSRLSVSPKLGFQESKSGQQNQRVPIHEGGYIDTRTFPFLILISCIGHQRVKSEKQEFSLPEFPALRQNLTETFWIVGRNCLKTWRISNQIKKTKYILFIFQRVVCLPANKSGSKKWFQRELFGYQILVKWSLISILKQELSVN